MTLGKSALVALAVIVGLAVPGFASEAPELWKRQCASCHGQDGRGVTKAGRRAGVKDLTDAAYQKSFTDERLIQILKEGLRDGNKQRMKPFADKLTEEQMKALVQFVRGLQK